jgi:hypothetical protein
MRIVLLLVSFFWAFPVGIIIGVVYLTRAEPGKKAFGKQVLMVVALHFIMSCVLVGFFSAFGTASGT